MRLKSAVTSSEYMAATALKSPRTCELDHALLCKSVWTYVCKLVWGHSIYSVSVCDVTHASLCEVAASTMYRKASFRGAPLSIADWSEKEELSLIHIHQHQRLFLGNSNWINIQMVCWNFISTSSSTEGTIQSGCAEGAPLNEALLYHHYHFSCINCHHSSFLLLWVIP